MVFVKKRDGNLETFDPSKIQKALIRAGANKSLIKEVIDELQTKLYDGIPTQKIFYIVFELLRKRKKPLASRFNLKTAIANLGPSGYNFEVFTAHVLEEKGYLTQLNQIVQGKDITHEVDIIAKKNNENLICECKFHNKPWTYCPIQTALYTYARFLDVKINGFTQPMLITNTRFSPDAIKYSRGVNMKLLGWKYPKHQGLEQIIDKKALFPITILQDIDTPAIGKLLRQHVVLIRDLIQLDIKTLSQLINKPPKYSENLIEESRAISKLK